LKFYLHPSWSLRDIASDSQSEAEIMCMAVAQGAPSVFRARSRGSAGFDMTKRATGRQRPLAELLPYIPAQITPVT